MECLNAKIFSHATTTPSLVGRSALILLSLLTYCLVSGTAHAQLRSGRTARLLYSDQTSTSERASSPRQPGISTSSATRSSQVRQASGERAAIVVSSGAENHQVAVAQASSVEGACDDCGDGFGDSFGVGSSIPGYSDCICNNPECASCASGYSDLAPACTSMVCAPGCGPLMSLWCRMSVRAEVPLYWRPSQGTPALVTTAPDGTDPDLAGELGQSTTRILLGNGAINDTVNAGVRLTLSTWLDAEQRYSLMFRYWNAGDQEETLNFSSNEFPILARPFLDTSANTAVQNTQLVAFPGDSIGNISVEAISEVEGLELTLKRMVYRDRFTRIDWLYGYQHVSINEGLNISSNTTVTGNLPGLQGNAISVSDRFRTENDFNGMAYGLMGSRQFACWKMESLLRLGLGNLRRKVNINGSTTTTANGTSLLSSQGLLARNTNDQPFEDDTFVVVPELGLNFATTIRPGLDFNIGYNHMWIPKVAHVGHQINDNLAVNLNDPLTGRLDPTLNFREHNYWISSLGLGFQLRY